MFPLYCMIYYLGSVDHGVEMKLFHVSAEMKVEACLTEKFFVIKASGFTVSILVRSLCKLVRQRQAWQSDKYGGEH